jgi:hypothetical protein
LCGDRPIVHGVLKDQGAFLCKFKQSKAAQNPGDEGATILQSTGNYSPKDTALHPRRLASFK